MKFVQAGVVALVVSLSAASAAEAHRLNLARADKVTEIYVQRVIEKLAEDEDKYNIDYSIDECERRGAHRAICDFAYSYRVEYTSDYYVCSARLAFRTRNERSRKLVGRLARHSCEQVN